MRALATLIAMVAGLGLVAAPAHAQDYRARVQGRIAAGDFSQTHVGDATDTSPFPDGAPSAFPRRRTSGT
jgi:hypothetical protein